MEVIDVIVIAGALVLSALGGWPVAAGVLRLSRAPRREPERPSIPGPDGRRVPSLERLGTPGGRSGSHDAGGAGGVGEARGGGAKDPAGGPGGGGEELLRGGRWIGVLERLATTGAVLAGRPELIAIIVALKGLGRYPELKERIGASERFLVGTLASLLWATACGAVALLVPGLTR